ncbi:polysaccharide pyruvyl transferase family protein [Defluviimonas sp. D31]|uniref:polysaccharide pyruvyl transferase family protein n=1 Tax=Defluviimonas sp. D31 TaxID=3083253 RepID=UPI00296E810D|nr:polysaccharide pyruvyl transferase family protein [Defluviimonas sp. D31]MDW4549316.1 polysaccharide pyruvyl transferase family protein [Defluviimonas sp. D31]
MIEEMTALRRKLSVSLIFHSCKNMNLGVGALTVADIDIIRRNSELLGIDTEITVIDWKNPRKPYVAGNDISIREIGGRDLVDPGSVFALMRRSDIAIDIGAGDSFSDIYGARRLRRLFALKFLAHAAGCPLVVAPQTIGPFTRAGSRRLARATLNRSALVATRDEKSISHLREIGYHGDVVKASDVALRLPYDKRPARADGRVRVGINVSGLLMARGYTGANEFGLKSDYPAMIRGLIEDFLAREESCELHLVSHVISHEPGANEDDLRAARALGTEYPSIVVAPAFDTPSDAKSYISGLDFFAGARMHACIAAFSSGVPVVPMAYSLKFSGLFGALGYDHVVDCVDQGSDDIRAFILEAFGRRAELANEMIPALENGLARLGRYEDALRALMDRHAKAVGG